MEDSSYNNTIQDNSYFIKITGCSPPQLFPFFFKEDDFSPLTDVFRPVFKYAAAKSIFVSSNVSGHVKVFYQYKAVKYVCSSNVSKQNACNVSSICKLVEPLTGSKSVCSTIVSKSNIVTRVLSFNTSTHYMSVNL